MEKVYCMYKKKYVFKWNGLRKRSNVCVALLSVIVYI